MPMLCGLIIWGEVGGQRQLVKVSSWTEKPKFLVKT